MYSTRMIKLERLNENELLIPRVDNGFRLTYMFFCLLAVGTPVSIFLFPCLLGVVVFFLWLPFVMTFWHRLSPPANFWPLRICKSGEYLYVNKKAFRLDELIFLSFSDHENCTTIRLEARRNYIIFSKEARLISNCSNVEEAIQLCRKLRDFINPQLKINYIRLVKGKSNYMNIGHGGGRGDTLHDHWEFID